VSVWARIRWVGPSRYSGAGACTGSNPQRRWFCRLSPASFSCSQRGGAAQASADSRPGLPTTVSYRLPATAAECQVDRAASEPCVDVVTLTSPTLVSSDGTTVTPGIELPATSTNTGATGSTNLPCVGGNCSGGSYGGPGYSCGTIYYTTSPARATVTDVTGQLWKFTTYWNYSGTMCSSLSFGAGGTTCNRTGRGFSVDLDYCGQVYNNGAGGLGYARSRTQANISFAFHGFPLSETHYMALAVDIYGNGSWSYG